MDNIDRIIAEQKARDFQTTKANATSKLTRAKRDFSLFSRFFWSIAVVFVWFWQYLVVPIAKALWWSVCKLFRGYANLWVWLTYKRDPTYPDVKHFMKVRGIGLIIATALFVFIGADTGFDAALYAISAKRHEKVYLINAQEINYKWAVHSIKGCTKMPCTDEDSIYFRVQWTPFNQLWNVLHARGIFYPEYVAAAVPSDISRCVITSYGLRIKTFMRGFDLFPEMLESSCQPIIGEKDKQ